MKQIRGPLNKEIISRLRAGEEVFYSGIFYTARDQAHRQLVGAIKKGRKLPVELINRIIYYCGPAQTPKGKIIGSCGPTTSNRMDSFIEPLLKKGLIGMVGKGRRSEKVKKLIKKYKAVYFLAPSGCGAMLAERVKSKKLICFAGLGPEAVYRLEVENFPLIVGIDSSGKSFY